MPSARPRSAVTSGGNVRSGFEGVVDPASRRALFDMRRLVDEVGERLEATDLRTTPTAWVPVTFQNGWTNFGPTYYQAAFRKEGDIIRFRGLIKGTTQSVVGFTLPVGYRPGLYVHLATAMTLATSPGAILGIASDGSVTVHCASAPASGVTLDGLTFVL